MQWIIRIFFVLCGLSVVFFSCDVSKKSGNERIESEVKKAQAENLIVSFKKTACFGKCPQYEYRLYKNLQATYDGIAHVEDTGLHRAEAPAAFQDYVNQFARKIRIDRMDTIYPSPEFYISDLPAIILEVHYEGKIIRIQYLSGYEPDDLRDFSLFVMQSFERLHWKKANP